MSVQNCGMCDTPECICGGYQQRADAIPDPAISELQRRADRLKAAYEAARQPKESNGPPHQEPLADQLRERDERIRKLEEAARAAYAHVIELQDAWIRGALSEHDGLGGTRSNRNDDVLHLITHALGEG